MTRLILIIILISNLKVSSQTFVKDTLAGLYHKNEPLILLSKKMVNEVINLYILNNMRARETTRGDTTIFAFPNEIKMKRKLLFEFSSYCNFDQLIFYDKKLAQEYLKNTLEKNEYDWKIISDNTYLSKFKYKLKLTIKNNKVTFTKTDFTEKEYKELINQK